MSKRLVIIPAYNESGSIVQTVKDIKKHAPSFDYLVINDCSKDNTRELLEEHGIHHVNLPVNTGIGGAVQTGYLYAKRHGYDYAIQVDGDGQHDAKYLEPMAEQMEAEGLDLLIGSRFIAKEGFQSSAMRRFGIKYFTGLIRLCTHQTITDPTSGMRMASKRVIDFFAEEYPKDYPEPESVVTVLHRGLAVKEIPVEMKERQAGVSSISPKKSIYYMIKVSIAVVMAALES